MSKAIARAVFLVALVSIASFVGNSALAQGSGIKLRTLLYSGRSNPQTLITDPAEINTLRGFLVDLPATVDPSWPTLGFRGYLLLNNGIRSFPPEVRVFRGVIRIFDGKSLRFFIDVRGLEEYLRDRTGTNQNLKPPHQPSGKNGGTANRLPISGGEPPYEPDQWNDHDGIQDNNNCYNYACNKMTGTFAQPGRASGFTPEDLGCNEYNLAAESDGLVATDCDEGCDQCHYKVALVMDPGVDFHWYRQDDNGDWSHKPGETEATNLDDSFHPITDPRTADRGDYSDFCGCFCVNADPSQVTIN